MRDAVRLADRRPARAGLDRITDGEMQRVDFNLGFTSICTGWSRSRGSAAGVRRPTISAIAIGRVEPLIRTGRARNRRPNIAGSGNTPMRPVKIPVPGPFTLAGCIDGGAVYADRAAVTEALIPIVNAELRALPRPGSISSSSTSPASPVIPKIPSHFWTWSPARSTG